MAGQEDGAIPSLSGKYIHSNFHLNNFLLVALKNTGYLLVSDLNETTI